MKRHAQLAVLTSLLLFVASAAATTAPPAQKVVFVGDQVTSLWPLTQTNPNWTMRDRRNVPRQDRLLSSVVCFTHGVLFVCPRRLRLGNVSALDADEIFEPRKPTHKPLSAAESRQRST